MNADKQAVIDAMSLANQRMAQLESKNAELCFLLGAVLGEIHNAHGTLKGTISGETLDRMQKLIYPQKKGAK